MLKKEFNNFLNAILKHFGRTIIKNSLLYDWQRSPVTHRRYNESKLPNGAENYLQENHYRLKELRYRYNSFNQKVTNPLVWQEDHVKAEDIKFFRGDNAYVWQLRESNINIMAYALTAYYVKAIDNLNLLEKMVEDDYFGNFTFLVDKKILSRDLLDSIIEIYFLEKHLHISSIKNLTVLDVGAGYGRLAHRMVKALPNISSFFCTDAVAVSTFISEYYLRFRNLEDKTKVIPLDKIDNILKEKCVDLAINIHSFSECQISAIDWWLYRLSRNNVKYLMIAPNAIDPVNISPLTNDRQDINKIVENHGYKLIAKEPKYRDPVVQEYAIFPTYHFLYKLC